MNQFERNGKCDECISINECAVCEKHKEILFVFFVWLLLFLSFYFIFVVDKHERHETVVQYTTTIPSHNIQFAKVLNSMI